LIKKKFDEFCRWYKKTRNKRYIVGNAVGNVTMKMIVFIWHLINSPAVYLYCIFKTPCAILITYVAQRSLFLSTNLCWFLIWFWISIICFYPTDTAANDYVISWCFIWVYKTRNRLVLKKKIAFRIIPLKNNQIWRS